MRISSAGRGVFAAVMIGIGVLGLVASKFIAFWVPTTAHLPFPEGLARACALVSLFAGLGLLSPRIAVLAPALLLAWLLPWSLLSKIPAILQALGTAALWESLGEALVVAAGAWALFAHLAGDRAHKPLALATGACGLRIARMLLGLALLPLGVAHFAYVEQTAVLVPNWLPEHAAWVYVTGASYVAAGVALLAGVCTRLAAALAAAQMGLFTLLVWLPYVIDSPHDLGQWSELLDSAALAAAAWVVARAID
ncbi:MAG TPA: DoxX family membrane protein [Pirellulales bacterium]|jgi:uncharacterized membrane protein|nr:DoxX family membrane protein [Pirellulales bacterium]